MVKSIHLLQPPTLTHSSIPFDPKKIFFIWILSKKITYSSFIAPPRPAPPPPPPKKKYCSFTNPRPISPFPPPPLIKKCFFFFLKFTSLVETPFNLGTPHLLRPRKPPPPKKNLFFFQILIHGKNYSLTTTTNPHPLIHPFLTPKRFFLFGFLVKNYLL